MPSPCAVVADTLSNISCFKADSNYSENLQNGGNDVTMVSSFEKLSCAIMRFKPESGKRKQIIIAVNTK